MKDLYKMSGFKFIGIGGIKCPCCGNGLTKKGRHKATKHMFSSLRRSVLKRLTFKEIRDETDN
jgi:hypothetical protein